MWSYFVTVPGEFSRLMVPGRLWFNGSILRTWLITVPQPNKSSYESGYERFGPILGLDDPVPGRFCLPTIYDTFRQGHVIIY